MTDEALLKARRAKELLRARFDRPSWLQGIGLVKDSNGVDAVGVNVDALTPEVRSLIPSKMGDVNVLIFEVGGVITQQPEPSR